MTPWTPARIRALSARKALAVGCQLSLRDSAQTRTLKRLIVPAKSTIIKVPTASQE